MKNKQCYVMLNGKDALGLLIEGNRRYVHNNRTYPNQSQSKRLDLKKGQTPHTVILGCSDSRVPPEHVFDQGFGDLFVVRVAGNVIDDIVLGSIEYAVEHLEAGLLMVLGHSDCGAVQAARSYHKLGGHLPSIAEAIKEAVSSVGGGFGDLNSVVRAHARITAGHLRGSLPVLAPLVESGSLVVVSAFYDFDTGIVELLD
jgi:carbonic anhydrase